MTEKVDQVQFEDPSSALFLLAMSIEASSGTVDNLLNVYVTLFRDPATNLFTTSTLGKKDKITLGDGSTAVRQEITGKTSFGMDLTMQIACARTDTRVFTFVFFGDGVTMKAEANLMDGIYETIYLGENAPGAQPWPIPTRLPAIGLARLWESITPAFRRGRICLSKRDVGLAAYAGRSLPRSWPVPAISN